VGKYRSNGERIGSGSYSNVYKGWHRDSRTPVAIKVVDLFMLSNREPHKKDKLKMRLKIEIRIAQQTNHLNLVKLFDVIDFDERVYLIFEYCDGGDFGTFLKNKGPLSESEARGYFRQITEGMIYLDEKNIIHRDLKPQNLLLKAGDGHSHTLKIADFGFAKEIEPDILSETICGSPLYMAPELLHSQPYSQKADLWSLGVILYEMLTGLQPIPAKSQMELVQNIKSKKIKIPNHLSSSCQALLMGLLRKKEECRMSLEDIIHHPWLSQFQNETPRLDSKPPMKIRSIVETWSGIQELFALAESFDKRQDSVIIYHCILHCIIDLLNFMRHKLESKELITSKKIHRIVASSIDKYSYARFKALKYLKFIDKKVKVNSLTDLILQRVSYLEKITEISPAISLLVILEQVSDDIFPIEISREIKRLTKKKKIYRKRLSLTKSSSIQESLSVNM
jgi:serine/threonine protein kinase